jgi:hypothetical protein
VPYTELLQAEKVKTPTELLIVGLMIFVPVVVAACLDHELSGPEPEQVCSCDPHLKAYLELTGQSFHLEKSTGDRMGGVVDDDYREQQRNLAKSAAK